MGTRAKYKDDNGRRQPDRASIHRLKSIRETRLPAVEIRRQLFVRTEDEMALQCDNIRKSSEQQRRKVCRRGTCRAHRLLLRAETFRLLSLSERGERF